MLNPNPSPHSDLEVLTRFQEELARAAALPGVAPASAALWPRFAAYYQGLARLPRKARRVLQRRWRRSLGGLALLLALGQAPALAATIAVDGTSCTLIDAITAANDDAPTGGCAAGNGVDTLVLPAGSTHTLTAVNNGTYYSPTGLPLVTSGITIAGNGSTIARDPNAPQFRILAVAAGGDLTLQEITISGGVASNCCGGGGVGGGGIAIFGGALTLTNSTVSGNAGRYGVGGVLNSSGTVTLTNSTVSGNHGSGPVGTAGVGGVSSSGTLTLTNTNISGNTSGGVFNYGTATLTNSAVSGNQVFDRPGGPDRGGGVHNIGTLTLTNSTVSGNRGFRIGGVFNSGTATLTNGTVSGNTAFDSPGRPGRGGGVHNIGALILTNSTVSGNSASTRGGGVFNYGTLTLTNSTVSGNTAGNDGGGLSNPGRATLALSLVSGNTAVRGAEIFIDPLGYGVTANNFNLFGHGGLTDYQAFFSTFTPGPSDLTATAEGTRPTALGAILGPTLADNGGPTKTHALVPASPAVDAVPAGDCVLTTDQRGAPRPQDGDGTTVADCDIGAFELGTQPPVAVPANQNPQARCTASRCDIRITCNLDPASGAPCTVRIDIFVSRSAARSSEAASTEARRRIRFASGVTNIPAGETRPVRLRLTKQGRRIVRTSTRRSLRGVLEIRNSAGTVSSTRIRIRLR